MGELKKEISFEAVELFNVLEEAGVRLIPHIPRLLNAKNLVLGSFLFELEPRPYSFVPVHWL